MGPSRRNILVAGLAAPLAHAWQRSPNDQIRLAFIGAGGRARDLIADLGRAGENVTIAAVCDVWRPNRESFAALAAEKFGTAPKQTTRYQEVLAMRDVDAVLIATPDFTHPKILADAIAAGKDAYVEKPFAVNFADAKMAYQAVKASKQVVQVGTQRRSDPGLIGIARTIQAGTIGKVTRAAMEVHFQEARWRRDYHNVQAEDVDWEAFQFGGVSPVGSTHVSSANGSCFVRRRAESRVYGCAT